MAIASSLTLAACGQPGGLVSVGQDQSQIIGGVEATGSEDYAPSVAVLYNVVSKGLCTGSIVSDSLLVTAAHCVAGSAKDIALIFGTDAKDLQSRVVRRIDGYKVSPLWPFRQDEKFNSGDIALVKFSGGLPPGFRPAQILTNGNANALRDGATVVLAGYGISDAAKHEGSGRLRATEVKVEQAKFSESEVLVAQNEGRGACHGDSGGPAYVRVNGQLLLWGVTNRGMNDPGDTCAVSAVYARIPFYQDWLKQTATELASLPSAPPIKTTPAQVAAL